MLIDLEAVNKQPSQTVSLPPENIFISLVVPVYNEEVSVPIFYAKLKNILNSLGRTYEIIFVDDGSTDATGEAVERLRAQDSNIKMIQFSRNFGKEMATTAGIHACQGRVCVMIDADLQHPVELLPEFIQRWERGAEVVVGIREYSAREKCIKKMCSSIFYRIVNLISDTPIVKNSTDYRLLDKKVIQEFNKFTERNRMTRGLIAWLGFKRDFVRFNAGERMFGKTRYGYIKLIRLAAGAFVSHSLLPLKLAGYLGVFTTVGSVFLGLFIVITQYIYRPWSFDFSGPVQLAVLLLFLVGIVLCCLGLMALYIGNINGEVNNRPLYVIRKRLD